MKTFQIHKKNNRFCYISVEEYYGNINYYTKCNCCTGLFGGWDREAIIRHAPTYASASYLKRKLRSEHPDCEIIVYK